jgi:hypothetical protein
MTTYTPVTTLLAAIETATHQGERQQAYQLSTAATRLAPRDAEVWLRRAETAPTPQETFLCLCRALLLDPKHSVAQQRLYDSLQHQLRQDAFLAYIDESDTFYRVRTGAGQPIIIPKSRTASTPYSPSPLQPAFHWLRWALIGLLLAGLGTLVCAPIAIALALRAWQQPLSRADSVRLRIVLLMAVALWCCAIVLSLLLLIHL